MKNYQSLVIKVTGKAFDNEKSLENIKKIKHTLDSLLSEGYKVIVVTGGGNLAREEIKKAKYLNLPREIQDRVGIEIARKNAVLMNGLFGVNDEVPRNLIEVKNALSKYDAIAIGGFVPGQSTTTVAAQVARYLGAKKMIVLTNVDCIFTSDPRKNENALPLTYLSYDELPKRVESENMPGKYELIDPIALKNIKEGNITVYITNVARPEEILNAVYDSSAFKGTILGNTATYIRAIEAGFTKKSSDNVIDLVKKIQRELVPNNCLEWVALTSEDYPPLRKNEQFKEIVKKYFPPNIKERRLVLAKNSEGYIILKEDPRDKTVYFARVVFT